MLPTTARLHFQQKKTNLPTYLNPAGIPLLDKHIGTHTYIYMNVCLMDRLGKCKCQKITSKLKKHCIEWNIVIMKVGERDKQE